MQNVNSGATTTIRAYMFKGYITMAPRKIGDVVVCPVCGKTFKVSVDSCCFISGEYTCDWDCFLKEVKRRDAEKKSKCK